MSEIALFVISQHGLHGRSASFEPTKQVLVPLLEQQADRIVAHELWSTRENQFWRSDRGVVKCIDEIFPSLKDALKSFASKHRTKRETDEAKATKRVISVVGHSFGGVLLRELMWRVHMDAEVTLLFDFGTYISVASPHCGVRTCDSLTYYGGKALATIYSQSIEDLLVDNTILKDRLISPDHLAAFARFNRRVLISNLEGDGRVSFPTASILYEKDFDCFLLTHHGQSCDGTTAEKRKAVKSLAASEHVLKPVRLRPSDFRASLTGNALIPTSFRTDDDAGSLIAATLRSAMEFEVVPVATRAWLPTAHNAIFGGAWFSENMNDVVRLIAESISSSQ